MMQEKISGGGEGSANIQWGFGKGRGKEKGKKVIRKKMGRGGPVLKFDIRKGGWRGGLPERSFANFQKYCRCELAYFC